MGTGDDNNEPVSLCWIMEDSHIMATQSPSRHTENLPSTSACKSVLGLLVTSLAENKTDISHLCETQA